MKKIILGLLVSSVLMTGTSAFADVTGLSIKFKSGCFADNTGSCKIGITADGTDLDTETVRILHSDTQAGPYTAISSRLIGLDANGRASKRFQNAAGCYKAKTGPNGDDKPDRTSRAVCEE